MVTRSGPTDRAGIRGLVELLLALFVVPLLDFLWPANLLVAIALVALALVSFREFIRHQSWALPAGVRTALARRPHRLTAMASLAIAMFIFLGSVSASILSALRGRLGSAIAVTPSVRMVQGASVAGTPTLEASHPAPTVGASASIGGLGEGHEPAASAVAPRGSPTPPTASTAVPIIYVAPPRSTPARSTEAPAPSLAAAPSRAATRPPSPTLTPVTPAAVRQPSPDDRAYVERVIPIMESVQTDLAVAAGQGDLLRRNPSLSSNGAWRSRTEASLSRLRLAGQQLEHLGPVPPDMARVDGALVGFGQSLVAVARDYTRAVDSGDTSQLSVADADVAIAAQHVRAVTRELQAVEARYSMSKRRLLHKSLSGAGCSDLS